jgi:DNA-binding CsgD family transcriptional regulator
VEELLGSERLVTLTGSGGCGKTRLAVQAAGLADRWPDGVWWVDLGLVTDPRTLDEAVAYARRARTSRSRPSTGWASLTPTEVEVVGLAADGLANPEIAARLFMSRNTGKTHLSHVYAKLGVTNRTELATLATARGSRPAQRR